MQGLVSGNLVSAYDDENIEIDFLLTSDSIAHVVPLAVVFYPLSKPIWKKMYFGIL